MGATFAAGIRLWNPPLPLPGAPDLTFLGFKAAAIPLLTRAHLWSTLTLGSSGPQLSLAAVCRLALPAQSATSGLPLVVSPWQQALCPHVGPATLDIFFY